MVHAHPHIRHHHDEASTVPLDNNSHERHTNDIDVEAQVSDSVQDARSHAHAHARIHKTSSNKTHRAGSPETPTSPRGQRTDSIDTRSSLHRRRRDTNNVSYGALEMGRTTGWMPGNEPGIDTSDPAPPYSRHSALGRDSVNPGKLNQRCEITCVDYSEENMSMFNLDNDNLEEHLAKKRPEWSQVRWVNVNGLSWDVIRMLGNYKKLHPLAVEDLMNTRSRTKADWYNDHTFIVLPLQKLMNTEQHEDSESDGSSEDDEQVIRVDRVKPDQGNESENDDFRTKFMNERDRRKHEERHAKHRRGAIATLVRDIMQPKRRKRRRSERQNKLNPSNSFKKASKIEAPWAPRNIRTLQRWHSGPNQDRIQFMERNSALSRKGLAVSMEQVSIFLCSDNTVISFFEYSAQDVELPIIRRLQTAGTILRQSCDASMLMESILDAIVDLAIPVTTAYQDTLGDLELEVLTDPAIHESKMIYVLTSEIAVLRNAIAPVAQLMGALKDHQGDIPAVLNAAPSGNSNNATTSPRPSHFTHKSFYNGSAGVTISHLTVMYLGDAEDHALLIQDSYDQMRRSADNLVDLIFNTVSAYQNESMKQLTLVTCFFLPLSFLTGYFGMNFQQFAAIDNSDTYFWCIAAPVSVAVLLLLLRDSIMRFFGKVANKALIARGRKRRLED